jgi:hypothetical protein
MNAFSPPPASDGAPEETDPRFRLDPARFPQRLELDLPEELVERLQRIAEQKDRSLSELIHNLVCQQLKEQAKDP